jgi:hypothetical protein
MREIKFRAWDKEHRAMKMSSQLDFLYEKSQKREWGMQGSLTDVWLNNESESYIPIHVILMQYTGLKDKNGKEIYEGDILHFDAKEWRDKEGNGHNFAIEWSDKGGCWCGAGCTYDWSEWCEVIGNIYENPELLQPSKEAER